MSIDRRTASRVFSRWIDLLYIRFRGAIRWPSREELRKKMPRSFQLEFGYKVAIILDCFEIEIERPTIPEIASQTWSNYKHHNTLKFLIGITPHGCIAFISKAYVGRASDTFITEDCGILNNLNPGDYVIADRGFHIEDSVSIYMAKLVQPTFLRGKPQLDPVEVEETRKISNVRIHVERVIGLLREKWKILSSTLKLTMAYESDSEDACKIDKIVTVCCALTNAFVTKIV